jgi:hypothetical protein
VSSERWGVQSIERYVRASIEICDQVVEQPNGVRWEGGDVVGSIELGIWYEPGSSIRPQLRDGLREVARAALVKVRPRGGPLDEEQADRLTDVLEQALARGDAPAWFIEVWNADEALSQVYAPYGMPRSR